MLISHSKEFIFVHNYKVAGTSIRYALKKYSDRSFLRSSLQSKINFLTGKYPNIYSMDYGDHPRAYELKENLPKSIFKNYFKFGFVRNPWDWQVSLYTYMLKRKGHKQRNLIRKFKDFDEYLEWRINEDLHYQKEFFYDDEGYKLVDYVGKFENIQEDFKVICNKIGILEIELPHVNKSSQKSYLKYYSQKSIDLLYDAFKPDIDAFGYEKPILEDEEEYLK